MRIIWVCCLLCLANHVSAQLPMGISFPKQMFFSRAEDSRVAWLRHQFPVWTSEDFQFEKISEKVTKHSRHIGYQIRYQQIPLRSFTLHIHLNANDSILSIKQEGEWPLQAVMPDKYEALRAMNAISWNERAARYWPADWCVQEVNLQWMSTENEWMPVVELRSWSKLHDRTLLFTVTGYWLQDIDQTLHASIDTIIHAKVFRPDPLTFLSQNYGGIYIDNNDANATWMNAAYVPVDIPATFDNLTQTFYPENQWVKIDEFESPVIAAATSANADFLFDRSQTGFEDVNALYHITTFHNYLSSLGYDTLMNFPLLVDTHGQFGADNSVFNRNAGTPTLALGTGGVDDAEDADVILHEYGHGISWSANANTNFSTERAALDEGIADYLATSYSRGINNFHWDSMFTWDGHNEFWAGRTATSTKNYPLSSPDIYQTGEIWNSAMSAIWGDLGQVVSDKLMLETLHFLSDQTTLPEAALYVLQSDTLLFGGIHSATLCYRFQQRNLFGSDCKPVGLLAVSKPMWQIKNTLGFANNESALQIEFPSSGDYSFRLVDRYGRTIIEDAGKNKTSMQLRGNDLVPGMYWLQVQWQQDIHTYPLMRY